MRRSPRMLALVLVAAFAAACADSSAPDPGSMAPEVALDLEAQVPSLMALQAAYNANSEAASGPELAFATTTTVYTFDDLTPYCYFNNVLPNPYQDLTFTDTPWIAVCNTGAGYYPAGNFLIPAYYDPAGYYADYYLVTEHTIVLPEMASSVTVVDGMWYNLYDQAPSVEAHDAAGNLVGTLVWDTPGVLQTKTLTGTIATITIVSQQAVFVIGDLSIDYNSDPTTKADCKNGGWEDYGFRNQGQCVRFVETGKDSR